MTSKNVRALREENISPFIVLQGLENEVANLKSLFAVGFDKNGKPIIYVSGTTHELSSAAAILQETAITLIYRNL